MRYAPILAVSLWMLLSPTAHAQQPIATDCNNCSAAQAQHLAKNRPPNVAGNHIVYVIDPHNETLRKYRVRITREYIDEGGGGYYHWMRRAFSQALTADDRAARDGFFRLENGLEKYQSAVDSASTIFRDDSEMIELNSELNGYFAEGPLAFSNTIFVLLDFGIRSFTPYSFQMEVTFADGSTAMFEIESFGAFDLLIGPVQITWKYVENSAKDSQGLSIPDDAADVQPAMIWNFPDGAVLGTPTNNDWNNFVNLVELYGIPVHLIGGVGSGMSCIASFEGQNVTVTCSVN